MKAPWGTAAEPPACRMVVFEKRRALGGLRVANDQHFPSGDAGAFLYRTSAHLQNGSVVRFKLSVITRWPMKDHHRSNCGNDSMELRLRVRKTRQAPAI